MFLESLTAGSSAVMVGAKRKQLKLSDVEQHVMGRRKLWFLHDHLAALSAKPKAAPKEGKAAAAPKEGKGKGAAAAGGAAGGAEPASGRRAITSFFGKETAPAAAADADAQMVDATAAEHVEEEEEE